jgi:hypothetical protein
MIQGYVKPASGKGSILLLLNHFIVNNAIYVKESGPYVYAGDQKNLMSDHATL